MQPTHLDLFSGIGGFALAAGWAGFRTVAFSEIDPEASRVLDYWFPGVPNLGDVCGVGVGHDSPTLLTGGVPCQPASIIGQRRGTADERWMWPQAIRIVGELRPRFAVFENPPALLTLESGGAFNGIASEFSALRYDLWWDVIPACAAGAGHIRERLLLVIADSEYLGRPERHRGSTGSTGSTGNKDHSTTRVCLGEEIADSNRAGLEGFNGHGNGVWRPRSMRPTTPESLCGVVSCPDWWREDITGISVLVHGIPGRLAEAYHRCTGNAVVPQAIFPVLKAIAEIERLKTP